MPEKDLKCRRMKAYDDALAMLRSIRAVPEDTVANIKLRAPSNQSPRKSKSPNKSKVKTKNKPFKTTTPHINNEDLESIHERESGIVKDTETSRDKNSDVFINTKTD